MSRRNELRSELVYLFESTLAPGDARDAVDTLDELIAELLLESTPDPSPVESAGDETGEAPHPAPCRYPASPYCCCTTEVAS